MSGPEPYYADDAVTLYVGDCREVLPTLGVTVDLVVADPPYQVMHTSGSCTWDRWPDGWLAAAAEVTRSLWCFGTLGTIIRRHAEFAAAGWHMSQDVIWAKTYGTGVQADRFRRAHEHVVHWYRGAWRNIYHQTPRLPSGRPDSGTRRSTPHESGRDTTYTWRPVGTWVDDGYRYALSVITERNLNGRGLHPTEKPISVLTPLIEYGCPPGGMVLDPFAGSGSTLEAARLSGRRAVGIEADERYAEKAALRLAQAPLEFEAMAHE